MRRGVIWNKHLEILLRYIEQLYRKTELVTFLSYIKIKILHKLNITLS